MKAETLISKTFTSGTTQKEQEHIPYEPFSFKD